MFFVISGNTALVPRKTPVAFISIILSHPEISFGSGKAEALMPALLTKISILLNPIIPEATKKVLNGLNIKDKQINLSFLDGKKVIPEKITIQSPNILFKKITNDN